MNKPFTHINYQSSQIAALLLWRRRIDNVCLFVFSFYLEPCFLHRSNFLTGMLLSVNKDTIFIFFLFYSVNLFIYFLDLFSLCLIYFPIHPAIPFRPRTIQIYPDTFCSRLSLVPNLATKSRVFSGVTSSFYFSCGCDYFTNVFSSYFFFINISISELFIQLFPYRFFLMLPLSLSFVSLASISIFLFAYRYFIIFF